MSTMLELLEQILVGGYFLLLAFGALVTLAVLIRGLWGPR